MKCREKAKKRSGDFLRGPGSERPAGVLKNTPAVRLR
jgi:hypothetical protein